VYDKTYGAHAGMKRIAIAGVITLVMLSLTSAFPQERPLNRPPAGFTALFNASGQPAMSVPLYWSAAGLPMGAHFAGRFGEESTLFAKDGKFYTSAGAMAGIDLALFLVTEDFGREIAVVVARKLLVYLQRDGGQEQYSEPADPTLHIGHETREINTNRMGKLMDWMTKHLSENLHLEILAKRALLSKHDFIQQFTHTYGVPPGLFVKNLRFNEARRRLMSGERATTVARSVGFHDPAYFIQEFRRRFGMLPAEYQRRFGSITENGSTEKRRNGFATRNGSSIPRPATVRRPRITSFTRGIRRHNAEIQAANT